MIIGGAIIGIAVILVLYYSVFLTNSAVIVRLVTKNPPVEGGIILPQNERRNWDPARIELTLGVNVTLVVVNNDDIEFHQLSIPDLNVTTDPIPPFESISIEFVPEREGTFTFIDTRPEETYTYVDYRGIEVNQVVDHSLEVGEVIVRP